jgi:hypothetical protein
MNRWRSWAASMVAMVMCPCMSGCETTTSTENLGGGYCQVTRTRTSWEPPSQQTALEFQSSNASRTIIWQDTSTAIVNDEAVLFVAEAACQPPTNMLESWGTESRVFGMLGPRDIPADITQELMGRSADGSVYVEAMHPTSNGVDFELTDSSGKVRRELTWARLHDVIGEVQNQGSRHTDPLWRKTYLQRR